MRDIPDFRSHKDASALRLSGWLENPLLHGLSLHGLLQVLVLVGEDVSFGQEHEVLLPVDFLQFCYLLVHEILSRDVERTREVVYFLVPLQVLVGCVFN